MLSSLNRESSSSNRESSSPPQYTIEVLSSKRKPKLTKIDSKQIKQKKKYRSNFLKLKNLYKNLSDILLKLKKEKDTKQDEFRNIMDELEKKKSLINKEIEDLYDQHGILENKLDTDLTEEEKKIKGDFEKKKLLLITEKDIISQQLENIHISEERKHLYELSMCIYKTKFSIDKLLKIFDSEEIFNGTSVEEIEELLGEYENNTSEYLKITKDTKDTTELKINYEITIIFEKNRINKIRDKVLEKQFEIKSDALPKIKSYKELDEDFYYNMNQVNDAYSSVNKNGKSGGNNTSSKKKYKNKKKTIKRGKVYKKYKKKTIKIGKVYKKYNKISSKRKIYKKRL